MAGTLPQPCGIRFRLMALAEHHGAEAVVRAYARAQAVPAVD